MYKNIYLPKSVEFVTSSAKGPMLSKMCLQVVLAESICEDSWDTIAEQELYNFNHWSNWKVIKNNNNTMEFMLNTLVPCSQWCHAHSSLLTGHFESCRCCRAKKHPRFLCQIFGPVTDTFFPILTVPKNILQQKLKQLGIAIVLKVSQLNPKQLQAKFELWWLLPWTLYHPRRCMAAGLVSV
jgi:hypothetical protein